jgi:uncharacterized protein with von Willebrand factor type A (vWA) domain
MFLNGLVPCAQNAALALGELIQSQYPDDIVLFVRFDFLARLIPFSDLSTIEPNHVATYGSNFQHAIFLARALLTQYPVGDKRIVIVTDGEPTAHLEGGEPLFNYPTTQRCIDVTLAEVEAAVRERIVVTAFLLNAPPLPTVFARQLDRITEGRAFPVSAVEPDDPKDWILDYYRRR